MVAGSPQQPALSISAYFCSATLTAGSVHGISWAASLLAVSTPAVRSSSDSNHSVCDQYFAPIATGVLYPAAFSLSKLARKSSQVWGGSAMPAFSRCDGLYQTPDRSP